MGRHAARLRPIRGPRVPPRQRDAMARGVPDRRAALGRDGLDLEHLRRRQRWTGPDPGRLAVHGRGQCRDRRGLAGPADDRGGPPVGSGDRDTVGRGRGGFRGPMGRRIRPLRPDVAHRGRRRGSRHHLGRGLDRRQPGRRLQAGHLHRVPRRGRQRLGACPRGSGPATPTAGHRRSGRRSAVPSSSPARESRCCSRARSWSRDRGSTTRTG